MHTPRTPSHGNRTIMIALAGLFLVSAAIFLWFFLQQPSGQTARTDSAVFERLDGEILRDSRFQNLLFPRDTGSVRAERFGRANPFAPWGEPSAGGETAGATSIPANVSAP